MKNKKTFTLIACVTLAVMMVLTATFAWFTSTDRAVNRLQTSDVPSDAKIVEVFEEPDDWRPGQTITKEVAVENTGEYPVFTRIYFAELLNLADGEDTIDFSADWRADKPAVANFGKSAAEIKAIAADPAIDGITQSCILLDYDAIENAAPTAGKWFYNAGDGYFYYIGTVDPGDTTDNLLESVTLDGAAGNAYANMVFVLTVNMQAIQDSADAIIAEWNLDDDSVLFKALAAALV